MLAIGGLGRWAWALADVHRLDNPIPTRGYQGLWKLSPELVHYLSIGTP